MNTSTERTSMPTRPSTDAATAWRTLSASDMKG